MALSVLGLCNEEVRLPLVGLTDGHEGEDQGGDEARRADLRPSPGLHPEPHPKPGAQPEFSKIPDRSL